MFKQMVTKSKMHNNLFTISFKHISSTLLEVSHTLFAISFILFAISHFLLDRFHIHLALNLKV